MNAADDGATTSGALAAPEIARLARDQLCEITGLKADTVSSLRRERNRWTVVVNMIELSRIPPATDVLAAYEVELDAAGRLEGYQRVRRYLRAEAMGEGS